MNHLKGILQLINEDKPTLEQIERIRASFYAYFQSGLAADILKTEDVIYNHQHKAKVLRFDSVKHSVEIEFTDKDVIPATMWVPISHVSQAWGGHLINPNTHCPKCDVTWKETELARFSVFDCPTCGAKREDHAT